MATPIRIKGLGVGTETGAVALVIRGEMSAYTANRLADQIGATFDITVEVYWADEVPNDLDPV